MKSAIFVLMALVGQSQEIRINKIDIYDPAYYAGSYESVQVGQDAVRMANVTGTGEVIEANEAANFIAANATITANASIAANATITANATSNASTTSN